MGGTWEEFKRDHIGFEPAAVLKALTEIESHQVELSSDGSDAEFEISFEVPNYGRKLGYERLGDDWFFYRRTVDLEPGETRVEQPQPLRDLINRLIDDIQADNMDDLAEMFPPAEQAKIKKAGHPPKERYTAVLKMLKELQSTSRPVILSADGSTAKFELPADSVKHFLTFKKIDGTWYVWDHGDRK